MIFECYTYFPSGNNDYWKELTAKPHCLFIEEDFCGADIFQDFLCILFYMIATLATSSQCVYCKNLSFLIIPVFVNHSAWNSFLLIICTCANTSFSLFTSFLSLSMDLLFLKVFKDHCFK